MLLPLLLLGCMDEFPPSGKTVDVSECLSKIEASSPPLAYFTPAPIFDGRFPFDGTNGHYACFQKKPIFSEKKGYQVAACSVTNYMSEIPPDNYLRFARHSDPFNSGFLYRIGFQTHRGRSIPTDYEADSLTDLLEKIQQDPQIPPCVKNEIAYQTALDPIPEGHIGGRFLFIFRLNTTKNDDNWNIVHQAEWNHTASAEYLTPVENEIMRENGLNHEMIYPQSFRNHILYSSPNQDQNFRLPESLVLYFLHPYSAPPFVDAALWYYFKGSQE